MNIIGRIQNYFNLPVTNYFDDKTRKAWKDFCANTPGYIFIMDKIPSEEIIPPDFMKKLMGKKVKAQKKFVVIGDTVSSEKPIEVKPQPQPVVKKVTEPSKEETKMEEEPTLPMDLPETQPKEPVTEEPVIEQEQKEEVKPEPELPLHSPGWKVLEQGEVIEPVEEPIPEVAFAGAGKEEQLSLEELTAGLDVAIENGTVENIAEPEVEQPVKVEKKQRSKSQKRQGHSKNAKQVDLLEDF